MQQFSHIHMIALNTFGSRVAPNRSDKMFRNREIFERFLFTAHFMITILGWKLVVRLRWITAIDTTFYRLTRIYRHIAGVYVLSADQQIRSSIYVLFVQMKSPNCIPVRWTIIYCLVSTIPISGWKFLKNTFPFIALARVRAVSREFGGVCE